MTPLERVLTALSHKEPDRVPLILTLTMHGAKLLGLSINDYFSRGDYVAEAQWQLREIYQHDNFYTFFYAAVEIEAWGGEVLYSDDGPPNAARPFLQNLDDIRTLEVPDVQRCPSLQKVLRAIEILHQRGGSSVPIVGVVMSPFSLPIMQMGFERYIELIYDHPDLFKRLMHVNEAFCVAWANAQYAAGATAIAYFDPMSSPTIIPRELYRTTGFPIAQRVLAQFRGAVGMLLASGLVLPIIEDIKQIGTAIVSASVHESLAAMKGACRNQMTILGNLNAIEMCRWTPSETKAAVKDAIAQAGVGGGFLLCDNHGEIPWQVPDETLHAISDAVRTWGTYPLTWVEHESTTSMHHHLS